MRWLLVVVIAIGCGKSGSGELTHPAPAAEAQAYADKLVAAINACDMPAIAALVDVRVMATRAARSRGASDGEAKRYADVTASSWGTGPCSEHARVTTAFVRMNEHDKHPRPLLRWWNGDTTFGYVELIVSKPPDKPAELFDFRGALDDQSVTTSLGNVFVNMPAGDQPGMTSDVVHGPFSDGLPQGGYTLAYGMDRDTPLAGGSAPPDPKRPVRVVTRGFMSLDYASILPALDEIEKRVGSDALLHSLRAAALTGAGHTRLALAAATKASELAPDSKDALLALIHAQVGASDLGGANQTLAILIEKHSYPKNAVRNSSRLRALAETAEFQKLRD